jgi:hypothetical protein
MIEPIALASITSAVTVLGNEFLKGMAGEAGKSTWMQIKSLFKWQSEPKVEDLPKMVATALTESPQLAEAVLDLLKNHATGSPSAMVGNIQNNRGKIVVVNTMIAKEINF